MKDWIWVGLLAAVTIVFVTISLKNGWQNATVSEVESLKKYQDIKIDLLQRRVKALEEQNKKWMLPPTWKGWEFGK